MILTKILDEDCLKVCLDATDKSEAIEELIDVLDAAGKLNDRDLALKAVLQREEIRSTGVGQGFAIPHGKCTAVKELVMAIGKTNKPMEFESIDKQPVEIIILLVSPTDRTGPHIQALAQISRIMTDVSRRKAIWSCTSGEELFACIMDE